MLSSCKKCIHNSTLFVNLMHLVIVFAREQCVIVCTWLQILCWKLYIITGDQLLISSNSKAVLSIVSVSNVVFSGRSINEWKWQYADKVCSCSSKREKPEPVTSDNCRMCGCCFKTQFSNFKSGWISSENMFVAPTRKRWNVTKAVRPSNKRSFRCRRWIRVFLHKSFIAVQNKG